MSNKRHKKNKSTIVILITVAVITLLFFCFRYFFRPKPPEEKIREKSQVVFVYDGDTIQLADKRKVRLIGLDAPEINYNSKQSDCFADEAKNTIIQLLNGQIVEMEKDKEDTDKYGRFLRYIYLDNVFINDFLLRQGYAHVMTIPPDTKYSQEFQEAEKEAKDGKRGLWGKCP